MSNPIICDYKVDDNGFYVFESPPQLVLFYVEQQKRNDARHSMIHKSEVYVVTDIDENIPFECDK